MTGINVYSKYLPYEYYYTKLPVPYFEVEPDFDPKWGVKTFEDGIKKTEEFIKNNEKGFTYFYWHNPDSLLHEKGTFSMEVIDNVSKLNASIESFAKKLKKNTAIIVTADHGHQDVRPIFLDEFKDLEEMLNNKPSLESRCMILDVKEGYEEEFKEKFNLYFSNIFKLYTTKEFIEGGFLGEGNKHPMIDKFFKTYVAIAISDYYFVTKHNDDLFKSHHAGLTRNEMSIPLIFYSTEE